VNSPTAVLGERLLRPGSPGRGPWKYDLAILLLPALLLIAAGIGLRDPWPADEPRFALIARDMAASGQWLFPQVGGDWYQDKPPLYFWLLAAIFATGAGLRQAFLLPSLVAALATLALTYDLGRRLWSRAEGLAAGLLLLFTLQFLIQARSAQIDMTLLLLTTAGLHGIARHLLAGPNWRAYTWGGFAAGLGVITKGTGFLPLLLPLVPLALARAGFRRPWQAPGGWRWALAPGAALVAISCWLLPMLIAVARSGDPSLAAYRDEILFLQTIERYADSVGHHQPWYYFVVMVIPVLWLPGTALLPWLIPGWIDAWRRRDPRSWTLLGWVALVVMFFSLSAGKRGIYVLPALPAFALAAAAVLLDACRRPAVQRVGYGLALSIAILAGVAAIWLGLIDPAKMAELGAQYDIRGPAPLVAIALASLAATLVIGPGRGLLAWAATLGLVLSIQGFWINPMIDGARSGRSLAARIEAAIPPGADLGLVDYPEALLLQLKRPTTNFGHRRGREGDQELADAALWLAGARGRWLLVNASHRSRCLSEAPAISLGQAARRDWYLVSGQPDRGCAERGHPKAARSYRPPLA
jgi:4-amino-4-deoxy-L-arabinose transferase-like glycosyltransferase